MNLRDPRALKIIMAILLMLGSLNAGMEIGKLENGVGTNFTAFALGINAIAVGLILMAIIWDVLKRGQ
jgi:hypothetical protein